LFREGREGVNQEQPKDCAHYVEKTKCSQQISPEEDRLLFSFRTNTLNPWWRMRVATAAQYRKWTK